MSEIKTNKISPRKDTTTTIGDSGDSVTIASGTTTTNQGTINTAGITGGTINNTTGTINLSGVIDWELTPQPGDFRAVANKGYFIDTSSGAREITMPSSPSAGDVVAFKDYALTFNTNRLTIKNGGDKIQGSDSDFENTTKGAALEFIYVNATKGWLLIDFAKASDIAGIEEFIVASGGTVTTSGDYKIHTFTSPGTFCVSCVGTCSGSNKVDYLVIAGGGGGGKGRAGGGGAGGYRTSYPSPQGTLPVSVQGYPITVGGGASGSSDTAQFGGNGNDSSAIGITSTGGGGGSSNGSLAPSPSSFNYGGHPGGSGGGSAIWLGTACRSGRGNTPPTTPPQGNPGGSNPVGWPSTIATGGGGGASASGGDGLPSNVSGAGGAGSASSITASPVTRAGGGGGGNDNGNTAGAGGTGGGGAGGVNAVGTNATINTGSGGGGGGRNSSSGAESNGGNGGSGIVVITYKYQ
tara:strand:+ start:339 stop:1733 length:1395 start_codon:yes stop_codon:yes gene_type:complete